MTLEPILTNISSQATRRIGNDLDGTSHSIQQTRIDRPPPSGIFLQEKKMAFVNEPISEEDRAHLDMKEIAGILPHELYPDEWTIDRGRNSFLIPIAFLGIPDDSYQQKFVFSWNGKLAHIRLNMSFKKSNFEKDKKKEEITWNEDPKALLVFYKKYGESGMDALNDLRDALIAYSNRIRLTEVKFNF
jgi:hypothetical protein